MPLPVSICIPSYPIHVRPSGKHIAFAQAFPEAICAEAESTGQAPHPEVQGDQKVPDGEKDHR